MRPGGIWALWSSRPSRCRRSEGRSWGWRRGHVQRRRAGPSWGRGDHEVLPCGPGIDAGLFLEVRSHAVPDWHEFIITSSYLFLARGSRSVQDDDCSPGCLFRDHALHHPDFCCLRPSIRGSRWSPRGGALHACRGPDGRDQQHHHLPWCVGAGLPGSQRQSGVWRRVVDAKRLPCASTGKRTAQRMAKTATQSYVCNPRDCDLNTAVFNTPRSGPT